MLCLLLMVILIGRRRWRDWGMVVDTTYILGEPSKFKQVGMCVKQSVRPFDEKFGFLEVEEGGRCRSGGARYERYEGVFVAVAHPNEGPVTNGAVQRVSTGPIGHV